MAKNYRVIIDKLLDLSDPADPLELAMNCENAAQVLRLAASQRDERLEADRLNKAVEPWFDPKHSINTGCVH